MTLPRLTLIRTAPRALDTESWLLSPFEPCNRARKSWLACGQKGTQSLNPANHANLGNKTGECGSRKVFPCDNMQRRDTFM